MTHYFYVLVGQDYWVLASAADLSFMLEQVQRPLQVSHSLPFGEYVEPYETWRRNGASVAKFLNP